MFVHLQLSGVMQELWQSVLAGSAHMRLQVLFDLVMQSPAESQRDVIQVSECM